MHASRKVTVIREGDGDPRHGTVNGYGNLRCSCPECRAAWAAHCRRERERMRRAPIALDDPRHGTTNLYTNWGCRCPECTAVATRRRRLQNAG